MSQEQEGISLPIVYVGLEDAPTYFANTFVIQHQQDVFVLTIAEIQQPIILGTPEERQSQAQKLSYVPARIVTRIGFTRERLVALINTMQENLRSHDAKYREQ